MIGFSGIPELGIPAQNPQVWRAEYSYVSQDSSYPWTKPEPLGKTIVRRLVSRFASRAPLANEKPSSKPEEICYSRYVLSANTPNLYPIRSASLHNKLLLDVQSAVCNLGYLPSRCEVQSLVPGDPESRASAWRFVEQRPADSLYVHVRAGDIMAGNNTLYKPLPIEMIGFAKSQLNSRLVFIGQLQESIYSRALRDAFPDDEFFYSDSEGIDFEIIRAAQQVMLSTSTFSWLAAWISEKNRLVLLPSLGLFNPLEAPEINLIDSHDRRFIYLVP